ncbi:MAG: hypothetical protein JW712_03370 [Dehalococcoidales bacterium]|nr:hypothetical protein [Dehalococcoidales bacterium]
MKTATGQKVRRNIDQANAGLSIKRNITTEETPQFTDNRSKTQSWKTVQRSADRAVETSKAAGVIQATWIRARGVRDAEYQWDRRLDGVTWYANGEGGMWFQITNRDEILEGDIRSYAALEGQVKSWEEWNRTSIRPHVIEPETALTVEPEEIEIPEEARMIMERFNEGGLLIKTLQMRNAYKDFQDALASLEEAFEIQRIRYGAKRNWSLAHSRIIPNYYLMNETAPIPRSIASLALPEMIGAHRFLRAETTDQMSNSQIKPGTEPLERSVDPLVQLERLKEELIGQSRVRETIDNSEIQTVGFSPDAVAGFMFRAVRPYRDWRSARSDFQRIVNIITNPTLNIEGFTPSPRRVFHIFTFERVERGTRLIYLDTLHAPKR